MHHTSDGSRGRLPTVDVAVVSWNHGAWLERCLASIGRIRQEGFSLGRVVVVDNGSTDTPAAALATHRGVLIVTNPTNRGFAAACNQAAKRCASDYVLFLNPDTEVNPDALTRAVALLEAPTCASVAILGLRLTDAAGVGQRTCGRFPDVRTIVHQTLGLSRLDPVRWPGYRLTESPHDESCDVDYVCAAAMIVRRRVFDTLGGFDERFFLYLEDVDLSLRAYRAGWRTRFCVEAVVEHGHGWVAGGYRAWRLAHAWRSLIAYGWVHLRPTAAAVVTLTVCTLAPVARLGEALWCRSWHVALDAAKAWLLLWRLLGTDGTGRWDPRRTGATAPIPGVE